jgi:hypothetical protein
VLAAVAVAVLLSSCAPHYLPYPSDYPMANETFQARENMCIGKIPQGWFYASEDTLAPSLLAWVVKEDYSASLTLKELRLDRLTEKRVEKEGLKLLANISMAYQNEGGADNIDVAPREFSLRGRDYCGYELQAGGERRRFVVFSAKGRYFECGAMPMKGAWTSDDLTKLFTAQQTFLIYLAF